MDSNSSLQRHSKCHTPYPPKSCSPQTGNSSPTYGLISNPRTTSTQPLHCQLSYHATRPSTKKPTNRSTTSPMLDSARVQRRTRVSTMSSRLAKLLWRHRVSRAFLLLSMWTMLTPVASQNVPWSPLSQRAREVHNVSRRRPHFPNWLVGAFRRPLVLALDSCNFFRLIVSLNLINVDVYLYKLVS